MQLKSLTLSWHTPPLWHGREAHSLTSEKCNIVNSMGNSRYLCLSIKLIQVEETERTEEREEGKGEGKEEIVVNELSLNLSGCLTPR